MTSIYWGNEQWCQILMRTKYIQAKEECKCVTDSRHKPIAWMEFGLLTSATSHSCHFLSVPGHVCIPLCLPSRCYCAFDISSSSFLFLNIGPRASDFMKEGKNREKEKNKIRWVPRVRVAFLGGSEILNTGQALNCSWGGFVHCLKLLSYWRYVVFSVIKSRAFLGLELSKPSPWWSLEQTWSKEKHLSRWYVAHPQSVGWGQRPPFEGKPAKP